MNTRSPLYRFAAVMLAALMLSSCYSYQYWTPTQRGAANGALLGAVAGGVIGSTSGNFGEGAIIGALAGSLVGGSIGYDREKRGYYGPRYYTGY